MPTTHAEPTAGPSMETLVRALPSPHREVLVATYFSGRTTREAAALLGLSPDAVKMRLHQAMRHLSGTVATTIY